MTEDEFEFKKSEDLKEEETVAEEPMEEEETAAEESAEEEEPVEEEETSETVDYEQEPIMFSDIPESYTIIEKQKKRKKHFPAWLIGVIVTFLICAALFAAYVFLIEHSPQNQSVTISYEESGETGKFKEQTSEVGAIAGKAEISLVSLSGTTEYESFFGVSTQKVSGTGMIVTGNGYILTSNSFIGTKGETKVKIGDKTYDAELVGRDVSKDLAVIKVDAEGLTKVTFGNSDSVKVGDDVVAIADIFGGEIGFSVSRGMICGVNKNVALENGTAINLLQTDAAPGNASSGGCLLNADGEVIGILTGSISANSDKITFAIPSNDIVAAVESIINTGDAPEKLIIGIKGTDTEHGVTVEAVIENTPAEKAGIKKGDLILKVDGKTVKKIEEINEIRDSHKKGDTIVLTVYRDGESIKIDIEL